MVVIFKEVAVDIFIVLLMGGVFKMVLVITIEVLVVFVGHI